MPADSHVPYLLSFQSIGDDGIGFLTIAENANLPFAIQRVYWTYDTPEDIVRGRHAHKEVETILIAVRGTIVVRTESLAGQQMTFQLDNASQGLYIPHHHWREMEYRNGAVQLCLASMPYQESDYIRSYEAFQALQAKVVSE